MLYIKQFIFSLIATIGFSVLFNVPKQSIIFASITGGIGWTLYTFINILTVSTMFSLFIASTVVGILGELFARINKKPVTTFIIPGIVPLVPGYLIYLSMVNLVNRNFDDFALTGTEALFSSGAISIGIILVSSISRLIKKNTGEK